MARDRSGGPAHLVLGRLTTPPPPLPSCAEVYPYDLVQLPKAPGLYDQTWPEHAWGTAALVQAVQDAALKVALAFPDADPVYVGDLSLEDGGPLPPHRYHSDGRSVDVGLFAYDGEQPQYGSFDRLGPFDLDVEKTWALMDGFLATGQVEHILLDARLIDAIRTWLVDRDRLTPDEAARIFPPSDTPRLWAMSGIVRAAQDHDDHFHVRFRCE